MSHARESLEKFLDPTDCDRSKSKTSSRSQIKQLLSDVEAYRQKGYSLNQIHSALVRGGDLCCTLTTFRTYYYQERQQKAAPVPQKRELVQVTDIEQWSKKPSVSQGLSEYKTPSSGISETDEVEMVPQPSDSSYEDKMKAHHDLAQKMFAARRAELKQQRGQQ